jgi:pimeloyl-ACP methyl ester carboxylesterase
VVVVLSLLLVAWMMTPALVNLVAARRFPQLVMVEPQMEGADVSLRAAQWWSQSWTGKTFMAVGMQDPVLGPAVMAELRGIIRGCPAPLEIAEGGHFVQEWGDEIAREALKAFGG